MVYIRDQIQVSKEFQFLFLFVSYFTLYRISSCKYALAGSVKDSVVGEERIAQYLLAILNTRGTPLHWRHLNNRTEVNLDKYVDKPEYSLKELRPKRMKPPNASDVLYIEVIMALSVWYVNGCAYHRLLCHRIVTLRSLSI